MGEVYRARDTRLNREVAVKVLSGVFAGDPERLSRIEREAQILASLNHANIAHIHGVEESSAGPALVMELVEGEELAARIGRGPLPQAEAIAIATQIVEALAAAHDKGIVHRDLKPRTSRSARAARSRCWTSGWPRRSTPRRVAHRSRRLPHHHQRLHETRRRPRHRGLHGPGAGQGSPGRQARGHLGVRVRVVRDADRTFRFPRPRRSPRRSPRSSSASRTGAAAGAHAAGIRRLLRRCLEKDPKRRLHDIADARLEIDDVRDGRMRPSPAARLHHAVARLGAAAVRSSCRWLRLRRAGRFVPSPRAPEARLDITTPPTADPSVAISPDGRTVVFAARSGTQQQLWVRSLDSSAARPLAGTENGTLPFWSPDSRSIGFFADPKLKRVDIAGGSAQTLSSNAGVPIGGTWNRDGAILFANNPGGSILRISARGGTEMPRPVSRPGDSAGTTFRTSFLMAGTFCSSSAAIAPRYAASTWANWT